jgi:integrase
MCKYCRGAQRRMRHAECHSKKPARAKSRVFLPEEVNGVITELTKEKNPALADAALVSLHTGMRMAEISALKWNDVDLKGMTIAVTGKNRTRVIAIPDTLLKRLKEMVERGPQGQRLFTGGHQSLSADLNRAMKRACEALGIPIAPARSLRETFAARFVASGASGHELLTVMGYKRPQ